MTFDAAVENMLLALSPSLLVVDVAGSSLSALAAPKNIQSFLFAFREKGWEGANAVVVAVSVASTPVMNATTRMLCREQLTEKWNFDLLLPVLVPSRNTRLFSRAIGLRVLGSEGDRRLWHQ